ncbi:MAG: class II D-tagatose-bisphosphate aldolase, non-catalytic subunit [Erysipelotrichaceae bacterium]
MSKSNPLKQIVAKQKQGIKVGIYSACSANEYVIKAVLQSAKRDHSCALIEATANQVDQNGGYTGMTPLDFRNFVYKIGDEINLSHDRIFLGGDHLGPLTFAGKNEAEAMADSKELVKHYVSAGFTKIHIDTSMKVASDDVNVRLSDEIIARRGASLVRVCEDTYQELLKHNPDAIRPVYIVGSEVPIPGGAQEANQGMQVTKVDDFKATVKAFEDAFKKEGLHEAWNDVMAVVVQPGVEEKDDGCSEYDRDAAKDLMAAIKDFPSLVFEGHSTDYQTKYKLRELVEDGVGILKVGPGLTYAMREGLFALANIEETIYHGSGKQTSNFIDVLETAMLKDPKNWNKHYHGDDNALWYKRKYSFSDRARYYMPDANVEMAKALLIKNLRDMEIPLGALSQFMPIQYTKVRNGQISKDPEALIIDRIVDTIDEYLFASHQEELF